MAQPDPAAFYEQPAWRQNYWIAYLRASVEGGFKAQQQPKHRPPGPIGRR